MSTPLLRNHATRKSLKPLANPESVACAPIVAALRATSSIKTRMGHAGRSNTAFFQMAVKLFNVCSIVPRILRLADDMLSPNACW